MTTREQNHFSSGPALLQEQRNPNRRRSFTPKLSQAPLMVLMFFSIWTTNAQINTGSDGHDGAFNPSSNTNVNMGDHPDGIYQYTSVNIPANVTVTFIPNAKNTPILWLVQSTVTVNGMLDLSGHGTSTKEGGIGGPGGFRGGNSGVQATSGEGPGGGTTAAFVEGGNASYGGPGGKLGMPPGPLYGNSFLIPLIGGSGGAGSSLYNVASGGGGGGAILVAAADAIEINGTLSARGSDGSGQGNGSGGGGSGGAVRLVSASVLGKGRIDTSGGGSAGGGGGWGRVRFDAYQDRFLGDIIGAFSQGIQPVVIPFPGQLPQLTVTSVAGVSVSPSPTGELATPDAVVSAQQSNPIPIEVQCANLPLHTQITVSVKPMNGLALSAVSYNDTGTFASSKATVSINLPRGGGLIYATAAVSN